MSHFGRSGPPDIRDTYSLLVLNITFRTSADDLFPLFDRYGKVVDVFIPRDRRTGDSRGFAFVRYKHAEEAQKAIERLDGRVVDGREIMVQFAKYGPNAESIDRGRISHSQERSPRRSRHRDNYYRRGSRSLSRSGSPNRSPGRRGRGGSYRDKHRDHGRSYRSRSRSPSRSRSTSPVRKRSRSRSEERPRRRSYERKEPPSVKRDGGSPRGRSPSPAKPVTAAPAHKGSSRGGRSPSPSPAQRAGRSYTHSLKPRSRSLSRNSDD
ncbi:hypothetical protein L7F22_045731 [Adiantum nelumboides]|nr:hypothetical protein [Adiantum nelumboides]